MPMRFVVTNRQVKKFSNRMNESKTKKYVQNVMHIIYRKMHVRGSDRSSTRTV